MKGETAPSAPVRGVIKRTATVMRSSLLAGSVSLMLATIGTLALGAAPAAAYNRVLCPGEQLEPGETAEPHDWSGCSVNRADLVGIDLAGWDLEGTEFVDSDLQGADLSGANLEGADLFYTDLEDADLRVARLSGAETGGADLTGALLEGAATCELGYYYDFYSYGGRPASLPEGWAFVGSGYESCLAGPEADMYGAYLRGADLSGIDLSGADLQRADLEYASIEDDDLVSTDLAEAVLKDAYIGDDDFEDADFAEAVLTEVESWGDYGTPSALPEHWTIARGYLIGPTAELSGAELDGADLQGADLEGDRLEDSELDRADLDEANLRSAHMESVEMDGASLIGADLAHAKIEWSEMQRADLTDADLEGTDLEGSELQETNLTDAYLRDAQLAYAYSGGIVGEPSALPEHWKLADGYLIGPRAELEEARLTGSDLSGDDLEEAYLWDASLESANLSGSNLARAYVGEANLTGADLAGANLTETSFENADLEGASLSAVSATGASWVNATCPDGKNAAAHVAESCLEPDAPGPSVTTGSASGITSSQATLSGTVNPNGVEISSCEIEYGTSPTLAGASSVSCGSPGSGTSAVAVSASATGLAPQTYYYFRVVATDENDETGRGGIRSFTTSGVSGGSSAPEATTGSASSITSSGATLSGAVNPNGTEVASCEIEYGTSPTLAGASSVSCGSPGSGTSPVAVSAPAAGLEANTVYYFRVGASDVNGSSSGSIASFTTLPNPPTAVTGQASSISRSSATLSGSVNPNGGEVTACTIEYGTSSTLAGASTASCGSPGSGTSAVPVSAAVSGLEALTVYYFRVKAASAGGEGEGAIERFTTLPKPPTVVIGAASSITHTTATLGGSVDPNGAEVTSCTIEYGPSLPSGKSVPCSPAPGSGSTPVSVTGAVSGLSANTTYQFVLSAANAGGRETAAGSFKTAAVQGGEFGRCVAVAAGTGRYSNSKCTTEGGKRDYEWVPGSAKTHVSFSGATVKLETAAKKSVKCTAVTGEGSFGAYMSLDGVTLTFTGCQTAAGKCASTGASEGEVRSEALAATLVWTDKAAGELAWDLAPSTQAELLSMQCGTSSVTISGSVLAPVKTGKASTTSSLSFKASKGVQKPSEYETLEGVKGIAALKVSFAGAAAEPIGLTLDLTLTSEEPFEISATD